MAIDISAEITSYWPQTEAKLTAEGDVAYATQKAAAVARAKVDVYGTVAAVPAEASIPDRVAIWVAKKATTYLIPLAKEYYGLQYRRSVAQQGATTTHYDMLAMLDGLREELEADCAAERDEILDLAGASTGAGGVPATSYDGMLIDPVARAAERGRW